VVGCVGGGLFFLGCVKGVGGVGLVKGVLVCGLGGLFGGWYFLEWRFCLGLKMVLSRPGDGLGKISSCARHAA